MSLCESLLRQTVKWSVKPTWPTMTCQVGVQGFTAPITERVGGTVVNRRF